MRILLGLLMCLGACHTATAQFSDSVSHHFKLASTGSINSTNTSTAYLFNNAFGIGIRKQKIGLDASAAWIYGEQNKLLTNNDINALIDMNLYPHGRRLYYWALANYTSSFSLKINNQYQAGGGVAYNLIDRDSIYINISDGLLYEYSDLQQTDTISEQYNTVRNSFRLKLRYTYRNKILLEGTGFLQNSLLEAEDYIVRANVSLGFKLGWGFTLTTAAVYNKFNRTDKENILFNYGLVYEKYF